MKKREIYDHLAEIYLSAPKKKKAKIGKFSQFKQAFLISVVVGVTFFIAASAVKIPRGVSQMALVVQAEPVKINYNLGVIKKEIYSLDLSNLDLAKFKAIGFSLRKTNPRDRVHLRVELQSSFKEIAQVYIDDVRDKWEEFKLSFNEFPGISDWSRLTRVAFVVEEWNTRDKKGIVYLDDVKFLK